MSWHRITNWAKRKPIMLRAADRLGRGWGRLRILDRLSSAPAPRKPSLQDWESHDLAATWIGHATVLLRVGSTTILTDPVFSNRIGIGLGLMTGGPRRLLAPALALDELPRIDLILISHAHFDHLDRPTLNRFDKSIPVVSSHHNADLIHDLGFANVTELQWSQEVAIGSLRLTAVEVRHWGARTFHDHHRGYSAFLIESAEHRVLYGGDTAHCDSFMKLGKVDLAILGIGGYDPYIHCHATPEQAWDMANQVRADYVLPMHHSTFRLSFEPAGEPMQRLIAAAGRDRDRLIIEEVGGQWAR